MWPLESIPGACGLLAALPCYHGLMDYDLGEVYTLTEIDPKTLAIAVNKLESFDFGDFGELSESHTKEMFTVMSLGTNLKILDVESIKHIDAVDPETLAKAVNNLESVQFDLEDSNLTLAQYIAIFKRFGTQRKLKTIRRHINTFRKNQEEVVNQ